MLKPTALRATSDVLLPGVSMLRLRAGVPAADGVEAKKSGWAAGASDAGFSAWASSCMSTSSVQKSCGGDNGACGGEDMIVEDGGDDKNEEGDEMEVGDKRT